MQLLVATAKPRILASVRRQARPETIAGLIRGSGVWDLLRARGIESTGHNVVVYWDQPDKDLMHSPGGVPVDIGAEVLAPFKDDGELKCTSTPSGKFIMAIHVGPYETLGVAHDAIVRYCRAERLRLKGPYWEFYGHWTEDQSQLDTSVCYSLK